MWGPFVGGHHSARPTHPWYSWCWDNHPQVNKPGPESVPGKVSVPWPSAAPHALTPLCLSSPARAFWANSGCGFGPEVVQAASQSTVLGSVWMWELQCHEKHFAHVPALPLTGPLGLWKEASWFSSL